MRDLILDATKGHEFDLAMRYCGIAPGKRGDREHSQPCPFCEGDDRFYFVARLGRFFCRRCGFGGSIIDLLIAVNSLTYWQAIELLAAEFGIILPKSQKCARSPQKSTLCVDWEKDRNDARMTIASLALAYMRFLPATDWVDFREASIETTREHASRLIDNPLREIVNMVAIMKHQGDMQKAWIALDSLYTGKDVKSELLELNFNRVIQEIRMYSLKEHRELEKEVELELERIQHANPR